MTRILAERRVLARVLNVVKEDLERFGGERDRRELVGVWKSIISGVVERAEGLRALFFARARVMMAAGRGVGQTLHCERVENAPFELAAVRRRSPLTVINCKLGRPARNSCAKATELPHPPSAINRPTKSSEQDSPDFEVPVPLEDVDVLAPGR